MSVFDTSRNELPTKGRGIRRTPDATATVAIRREDHIGDPLGSIFLEAGEQDAIIERLREYLGPRVKILKAEIGADRAVVEFAACRLTDEAARMAEAADALRRKGAPRSAFAAFKEALALDPLNVLALRGMGALLAARNDHSAAFRAFCRAREAGGDTPDVLHEMGRAAAAMGRIATAIVYLERACELAPDNFAVRRTLAELGRKPRATMKLKERAALNGRTRESFTDT